MSMLLWMLKKDEGVFDLGFAVAPSEGGHEKADNSFGSLKAGYNNFIQEEAEDLAEEFVEEGEKDGDDDSTTLSCKTARMKLADLNRPDSPPFNWSAYKKDSVAKESTTTSFNWNTHNRK